jgi:glycosyl transferase family 87
MLTRKRLRAYATIIAATLWATWAVDMSVSGHLDRLGKVKGTDFLHFYVMGSIVREGRWEQLFDVRAHQARAQAVVPRSTDTLYIPVESPQLALLLAPITAQPYTVALAAWLAISFATYACSCLLMWRDCPALRAHRAVVVAACAAFPGLYSEILHGQTACLSLAAMAVGLFALRRGWRFVAGAALGLLVFKPHWVLAAGVVFVVAREWRVVAGIVLSALAQLAVTSLIVGASVMRAYIGMLEAIPGIVRLLEPRPGDSLKGFFEVFVRYEPAAMIAYLIAAAVVVSIAARVWRSDRSIDIRLSAIVLATILISPHVNAYDLILAAPIAFMSANWLTLAAEDGRGKALSIWSCILLAAPLAAPLPPMVRLQFSVTAMIAMLFLLWKDGSRLATSPELRRSPQGTGEPRRSAGWLAGTSS